MTLCDIMSAALPFKFDGNWLSHVNWGTILIILFNPSVSNCLIYLLKQNQFHASASFLFLDCHPLRCEFLLKEGRIKTNYAKEKIKASQVSLLLFSKSTKKI